MSGLSGAAAPSSAPLQGPEEDEHELGQLAVFTRNTSAEAEQLRGTSPLFPALFISYTHAATHVLQAQSCAGVVVCFQRTCSPSLDHASLCKAVLYATATAPNLAVLTALAAASV